MDNVSNFPIGLLIIIDFPESDLRSESPIWKFDTNIENADLEVLKYIDIHVIESRRPMTGDVGCQNSLTSRRHRQLARVTLRDARRP